MRVARASSWAVFAFTLFVARDALAYCRTTTCDPKAADCTKNDDGCIRDGAPLTWTSMPITYRFQADGSSKLDSDATRVAVRAAFDAWSAIECDAGRTSLRFEEGSDIQADKPEDAVRASTPFGIYFRDDAWTHDDADESLALTNVQYGLVTGTIDYADIEINTFENQFALAGSDPGIDLQAVVTHEVGHYIGLAHSTAKDSIMVARYCQSDKRCSGDVSSIRALSDDDVAAVCALYPPKGIGGVHRGAVASPSGGCSTGGRPSWPLLGAAALLFIVWRRRRR
ncbi:MAG TPA: matrixin family metalloprotease [Labilithrix sp.]|jgi:hypothetical protein